MAQQQNFADRLIEAIRAKGSPICVGLDPRLAQLPEFLREEHRIKKGGSFEAAADCIFEFNKGIIDAVHDLVPAVKPQIAFYEQFGFAGMFAFEETCKYAKEKGLLVIADAKRGDIGSTAEAYAAAFLGKVDLFGHEVDAPVWCDALTVVPYLGSDGITPFVERCAAQGKGLFVLAKTSNVSSGELQDRMLAEKFDGSEHLKVYELMAHLIESWGSNEVGEHGYSSIGLVVGATFPRDAAAIRKIVPNAFFLVPGYGAQGATAQDIAVNFNEDGLGALVNSSRDIIFAYQKSKKFGEGEYAKAAREAVTRMREDLEKVIARP